MQDNFEKKVNGKGRGAVICGPKVISYKRFCYTDITEITWGLW